MGERDCGQPGTEVSKLIGGAVHGSRTDPEKSPVLCPDTQPPPQSWPDGMPQGPFLFGMTATRRGHSVESLTFRRNLFSGANAGVARNATSQRNRTRAAARRIRMPYFLMPQKRNLFRPCRVARVWRVVPNHKRPKQLPHGPLARRLPRTPNAFARQHELAARAHRREGERHCTRACSQVRHGDPAWHQHCRGEGLASRRARRTSRAAMG